MRESPILGNYHAIHWEYLFLGGGGFNIGEIVASVICNSKEKYFEK